MILRIAIRCLATLAPVAGALASVLGCEGAITGPDATATALIWADDFSAQVTAEAVRRENRMAQAPTYEARNQELPSESTRAAELAATISAERRFVTPLSDLNRRNLAATAEAAEVTATVRAMWRSERLALYATVLVWTPASEYHDNSQSLPNDKRTAANSALREANVILDKVASADATVVAAGITLEQYRLLNDEDWQERQRNLNRANRLNNRAVELRNRASAQAARERIFWEREEENETYATYIAGLPPLTATAIQSEVATWVAER